MFRITEDTSSGRLVQCFAKNYKNDSIVSVDMDVVGVMAAYAAITPTTSMYCTRLPDDGSSVIRNMLEHFYIFYNFNCIYIVYIVH